LATLIAALLDPIFLLRSPGLKAKGGHKALKPELI